MVIQNPPPQPLLMEKTKEPGLRRGANAWGLQAGSKSNLPSLRRLQS